MECLKCVLFIHCLFLLQSQGSGLACEIYETRVDVTKVTDGCIVTVSYNFNCRDQLHNFKVKERKAGMLDNLICTIKYVRGVCLDQSGCTCGAPPHAITVTRRYRQSQRVELEAYAQLADGTLTQKTTHITANCEQSEKTDDVTEGSPNQPSVNEEPKTVCVAVGVSLALALLIVTTTLAVVCCYKVNPRACAPRSARHKPTNAVTFRQVPAREQQDRGVVDSDESHHAYIEVKDDSGEPGTSATGRTSSPEAVDRESDGYLHPYTSPTSGAYSHRYSSLTTRRAKPDNYLNPIPSTSESTAAARTTDVDSPYEIA